MENLNDLYLHSMVHPDVAAAYINGENVPEAILQGEVPDTSVQAHYEPEPGPKPEPTKYTVKVLSNDNEMGTVKVEEVNGIQTKGTEITVDEGAVVKITATANEGYTFVKWNDGAQDYDTAIVSGIEVNNNLTFTATFEAAAPTNYTVTAVSSDLNKGTVSIQGGTEIPGSGGMSKEVEAGGSVTITATPINDGYEFVNWTVDGEPIGDTNPLVYDDINDNIEITANFEAGGKGEDLPGTDNGDNDGGE